MEKAMTVRALDCADTSPAVDGRGFHELVVTRVTRETADSVSLTLDVPDHLRALFSYRAGQFVTVRCEVDGEPLFRSYSMSSAPAVDPELVVTVKRVPEGLVSNWLNDRVREGDRLAVNAPGGNFVLDEGPEDIVAFAAGSGITPVISITKWALARTTRTVMILYANRDEASAIFKEALDRLCSDHPDRLRVQYSWDVEDGYIDGGTVTRFVGTRLNARFFVCGPSPFMDLVDATLMWNGVRRHQVHIERFTPVDDSRPPGPADSIDVIVRLNGKTSTIAHRSGATVLQTARSAGLRAPSSCETGECATCMARLVEGRAEMRKNGVLTPDEVAEGWVLTCQAVPVTPVVEVVYE